MQNISLSDRRPAKGAIKIRFIGITYLNDKKTDNASLASFCQEQYTDFLRFPGRLLGLGQRTVNVDSRDGKDRRLLGRLDKTAALRLNSSLFACVSERFLNF